MQDRIIQRLIRWGQDQTAVRAMILTSTRANLATGQRPNAPVDVLSDYDVVLVVEDIHPFFHDRTWLQDFGQVLVSYWDPIHPAPGYGIEQTGNVIQFEDGLKIDFTLWPVELLQRVVQTATLPDDLDDGYAVLLDKDDLTDGMPASTYTIYIPARPTEETYRRVIEEFFSDAPYVAKCLWRDELMPAKWCLDYDMKHVYVRQMLEWRIECEHGWRVVPAGALGKGLKKRLPPDLWRQLESAYAGAGIEENWAALFETIAVYRQAAVEVADRLGYAYPHDLDRRVVAYLHEIQSLDRQA
ncbi:MAG: aminoglycoside 6-adenylyltransferase [Anaerolineae bacterium]|nr:aminoglycoside 6-adenylyltransferase [Anaerolineae bacterium]